MSKILFATRNSNKLREAQEILVDLELLSPTVISALKNIDPAETGATFEENAKLKARAYGRASGLPVIAEDAGLEVASLNNQPGVHSARFIAGADRDRYLKVLDLLKEQTDRQARFVAVICWYDPANNETKLFRGTVTGQIAQEPRGTSGFGYDPIFIPKGYDQTFGELEANVKHQLSHRKKALSAFYDWWQARSVNLLT
ncbi:MAG: non-canonical purine NTP pyrophosphatase, RdgB/HAM1 family [Candidatus Pacebacteria bacterium RIFOXYB1_FULL_39_46]|nr:MAG: non-canonical purine NTP pyrophosphatase, RdgB/HAM1 family [Candidatus Pacebacteria bacterium RIFOXYA1_FULL_38_18]OGJ37950.1 MAG: non-canonical purine NTP pyrophosphatase, RdgB/HAM1 family [Candidatus Pacebacteria bacterium RIFOXYB1_FULL_39_46]OGJ39548.1 MAG: non-canonical purine NTP pyrophosphatase, RdgB/HAM1 family [Candidatus Pacebacteria bacterium RIFOXYC1_FULL_39_21]OGJ40129.1 MAG: non-canonical purine NTP pyrophosphatase, RdgB/HAM1 family [Candidatus Pacebacteria bacterium RIFOXYD1